MRRLAFLLMFTVAAPAAAHPLPNFRFDRTVHVRASPTGVRVHYTLQINAWTMVFDSRGLISKEEEIRIGGREKEFSRVYCEKKAPHLADGMRLSLDGTDIPFRVEKITSEPDREHLKFRFVMKADWTPGPGTHQFDFKDENFEGLAGILTLTLDKADDLELDDIVEPADLRGRSPLDWKPGDEQRSRKASATFSTASTAASSPSILLPEAPTPTAELIESAPVPLWQDVWDRGLVALFDSQAGAGLLLLAAVAYGMVHAFAPGHGKAMMAAYLIGERSTFWHVLVLGITTTLTHTGSVTILAFGLGKVFPTGVPTATEGILQLVGGAVIFAVGLWLMVRRLAGSSEAVPLFTESFNPHAFCCARPTVEGGYQPVCGKPGEVTSAQGTPLIADNHKTDWLRTVLLGVGSGLIPCWGAIILLVFAISSGRLSAAFPLLAAFSGGLAFVLVLLGSAVLLTVRVGGRQFIGRPWFRHLPALSAGLLVLLSIYHAVGGYQKLTAPTDTPPARVP